MADCDPGNDRTTSESPLIAAPMLRVSGTSLVTAVCAAGAIGAFPTANARSADELDSWLTAIERAAREAPTIVAPYCPNLIMRHPRFSEDLLCIVRHKAEIVITSVGSPAAAVGPLHDVGCLVLADVASLRHAEKALQAVADGLILLTAGAGGQTGWANPFAFARALRGIFDGPLVLAGGVSDGVSLAAACMLGCDLAYMGTAFIATDESLASTAYKEMIVLSSLDDIMLTRAFTGLDASMLRPSILQAGLDPSALDELVTEAGADEKFGGGLPKAGPKRWSEVWSAGHSVSGVRSVMRAADLVDRVAADFERAAKSSNSFSQLLPRR